MRKIVVSCYLFLFLVVFSSCCSTKSILPLSSLNGDWDIIELNDAVVVPPPNQPFPFISFDTALGRVSGNSGCNRMTGSFEVNDKPGKISFGPMAGTRMACPDMRLEQTILNVMTAVKKYKQLGEDMIILQGTSKHQTIVLRRRGIR